MCADRRNSFAPQPIAKRSDGRLELWVCTRCGYTFDGEQGEVITHTPPGTPFERLPEAWLCPHCTADKSYFFF